MLAEFPCIDGEKCYIYGDSAYFYRPRLIRPFLIDIATAEQREFSKNIIKDISGAQLRKREPITD